MRYLCTALPNSERLLRSQYLPCRGRVPYFGGGALSPLEFSVGGERDAVDWSVRRRLAGTQLRLTGNAGIFGAGYARQDLYKRHF